MEIPDLFQTIAEVGVAVAGFSGLIIVLRKSAGPLTDVQRYRLTVLLMLSFGALFLSMLPALLARYSGRLDVWSVANVAACLYSLTFVAWWVGGAMRIKALDPEIFDWFAFARMLTGHVLVILMQLASLFSLFGDALTVFAATLVWYLLHAAQQFTRMLFVRAQSDGSGG